VLSVALSAPKPGVFLETVSYTLVITTTEEVLLVAVTCNDDGVVQSLHRTKFCARTEGVVMLKAVGSQSGRIFLAANNGNLYEFDYGQELPSWFGGGGGGGDGGETGKRCKLINLSSRGSWSLLDFMPQFMKEGVAEARAESYYMDLAIDNARQMLYALSSDGTISALFTGTLSNEHIESSQLFHGARSLVASAVDTFSIKSYDVRRKANEFLSRLGTDPFTEAKKTTPDDIGSNETVVGLHVVPVTESTQVHLIVVLNSGVRIYLKLVTGSSASPVFFLTLEQEHMSSSSPTCSYKVNAANLPIGFEVMHVRKAPEAEMCEIAADGRGIRGSAAAAAASARKGGDKREKPKQTYSSFVSQGVFLCARSSDVANNEPSELLLVCEDLVRRGHVDSTGMKSPSRMMRPQNGEGVFTLRRHNQHPCLKETISYEKKLNLYLQEKNFGIRDLKEDSSTLIHSTETSMLASAFLLSNSKTQSESSGGLSTRMMRLTELDPETCVSEPIAAPTTAIVRAGRKAGASTTALRPAGSGIALNRLPLVAHLTELATQQMPCEASKRRILVLDSGGVHFLQKQRPIDQLAELLSPAKFDEATLLDFCFAYGETEVSAMCAAIVVGEGSQQVALNAKSLMMMKLNQPYMIPSEVEGCNGLESTGALDGLELFFSRLMRPYWHQVVLEHDQKRPTLFWSRKVVQAAINPLERIRTHFSNKEMARNERGISLLHLITRTLQLLLLLDHLLESGFEHGVKWSQLANIRFHSLVEDKLAARKVTETLHSLLKLLADSKRPSAMNKANEFTTNGSLYFSQGSFHEFEIHYYLGMLHDLSKGGGGGGMSRVEIESKITKALEGAAGFWRALEDVSGDGSPLARHCRRLSRHGEFGWKSIVKLCLDTASNFTSESARRPMSSYSRLTAAERLIFDSAFREIDTNGDDEISAMELHDYFLRENDELLTKDEVQQMMREADVDGNDRIDKNEFVDMKIWLASKAQKSSLSKWSRLDNVFISKFTRGRFLPLGNKEAKEASKWCYEFLCYMLCCAPSDESNKGREQTRSQMINEILIVASRGDGSIDPELCGRLCDTLHGRYSDLLNQTRMSFVEHYFQAQKKQRDSMSFYTWLTYAVETRDFRREDANIEGERCSKASDLMLVLAKQNDMYMPISLRVEHLKRAVRASFMTLDIARQIGARSSLAYLETKSQEARELLEIAVVQKEAYLSLVAEKVLANDWNVDQTYLPNSTVAAAALATTTAAAAQKNFQRHRALLQRKVAMHCGFNLVDHKDWKSAPLAPKPEEGSINAFEQMSTFEHVRALCMWEINLRLLRVLDLHSRWLGGGGEDLVMCMWRSIIYRIVPATTAQKGTAAAAFLSIQRASGTMDVDASIVHAPDAATIHFESSHLWLPKLKEKIVRLGKSLYGLQVLRESDKEHAVYNDEDMRMMEQVGGTYEGKRIVPLGALLIELDVLIAEVASCEAANASSSSSSSLSRPSTSFKTGPFSATGAAVGGGGGGGGGGRWASPLPKTASSKAIFSPFVHRTPLRSSISSEALSVASRPRGFASDCMKEIGYTRSEIVEAYISILATSARGAAPEKILQLLESCLDIFLEWVRVSQEDRSSSDFATLIEKKESLGLGREQALYGWCDLIRQQLAGIAGRVGEGLWRRVYDLCERDSLTLLELVDSLEKVY